MDAGGYPNQDCAIEKEIFKGTMFGGVDVSREGGIAHCELGLLGGTVMEGKLYSFVFITAGTDVLFCNLLLCCALIQCICAVGSERRQMRLVPRRRVEDRCVENGITIFMILGVWFVSVGSIQLPVVFTGTFA